MPPNRVAFFLRGGEKEDAKPFAKGEGFAFELIQARSIFYFHPSKFIIIEAILPAENLSESISANSFGE